MKKYKNIIWAVALYIVGILLAYIPAGTSRNFYNSVGLAVVVVLILAGIFFGFRSIKAKESSWAGHLVIVIGGLILASPLIMLVIGYNI